MKFRERTIKFLAGASHVVSHPIDALQFGVLKLKRNITKASWGLRYAMSKDNESMIDTSILEPVKKIDKKEEKVETRVIDSNVGIFNYLVDYTVNTSLDIDDIRLIENKINKAIEYDKDNDMLIKAFLVDNMDKTSIEKEDILIQFLSRISKDIPKETEEDIQEVSKESDEEKEDIQLEEATTILNPEQNLETYIKENEIVNEKEEQAILDEPNFILVDKKENFAKIVEENKQKIIKNQSYFESIFGVAKEAKEEVKEENIEVETPVKEEIVEINKSEKEEIIEKENKKVTLADKLSEVDSKLEILNAKLLKKVRKNTKYLVELASIENIMTSEKIEKIAKNMLKEKQLSLELDTLLLKKRCIEKLINKKEFEEQERKQRKLQEEQDIIDFEYGLKYDEEKEKENKAKLEKIAFYENFFNEQEKNKNDKEYIKYWENEDINSINPVNKLNDKEIKTYVKLTKKMGLR